MFRLVIAPQFRQEADEAWDYIAENSIDRADRFVENVRKALDQLAAFPQMGRSRDDLSLPGIRSFPVGRYVIFYRVVDEGIEALRLKHSAQDMDRFFE